MHWVFKGCLIVSFILPALGAYGQDASPSPTTERSNPRTQLEALMKAHRDARARFVREIKGSADEARNRESVRRYCAEEDRLACEAMTIARTHPREPLAADAFQFVVRVGLAARMGAPKWNVTTDEALKMLRRDHLRTARMGEFCGDIVLEPHDPAAEALILDVLDKHPNRDDRGHACHALATLRREQAKEIRWLLGKPENRKYYEDEFGDARKCFEDAWGKNLIARFLEKDPDALDAQADALLERVISEFGSTPQRVREEQKSLAELAETELLERRGLSIGKKAPEIQGSDHEGKAFKLSDFRGRIVLLTFSGNWCGACRALYKEERDLVDRFKYRPFVLLSVNTDEDCETLRKSVASGEIRWRCWWDGGMGPITERWGILTFPSIFLIDGEGVILARPTPAYKNLARQVEILLDAEKPQPTR